MSIEWRVRLQETFSVNVILAATRDVLAEVLGPGIEEIALDARIRDGRHGWIAADGDLELTDDTSVTLSRVGTRTDATDVNVLDVGMPEDEEGGLWLTAASYRTDVATLTSVCTVIAAATLTNGEIVDEPGLLGRRVSTPAQAIQCLCQADLTNANTIDDRASVIVRFLNTTTR